PPTAALFPYTTLFRSPRGRYLLTPKLCAVSTEPYGCYTEGDLRCHPILSLTRSRYSENQPRNTGSLSRQRMVSEEESDSLQQQRSEEHTSELQSRENL